MNSKCNPKTSVDTARASRFSRAALLVFLIALALRLVYLAEISKSPIFNVPIIDSQSYDQHARLLVSEGSFYVRFFWQGFFYPFFLAGVYLFSGGSLLWARIIQILLGSLMCSLVCVLGERFFDRRTGIVAGLITAFYGPLIYYDAEILDTGWSALWAVALMLVILSARGAKSTGPALLLGFIGGLSVVTRATFLPFLVAAGIWFVYVWRGARMARRVVAGRAALLVGGFCAVALPVAALTERATGDFNFLAESGPINLYIGNNPERDRTIMIRPGAEWRELTRLPLVRGSMSDADDRDAFRRLFVDYVRTEPGSYIAGLAEKAVEFMSTRELPRNSDIYIARRWSRLFSVLTWRAGRFGFPFGLLLPLGIVGVVRWRRRIPVPFYLFLVLYPVAVIAVFVSGRYRIPIVPILAIPAAAGARYIVDLVRARLWMRATGVAASICAIAAAASAAGPFAMERYNYEAELHTIVGFELVKQNRTREAFGELSKALSIDPDWPDAHKYLGMLLSGERRHGEAAAHFRAALEQDPDSYLLRYYLGLTLLNMGKRGEGLAELRSARKGAEVARENELLREIDAVLASAASSIPPPDPLGAYEKKAR